jgi:hypothetical protein
MVNIIPYSTGESGFYTFGDNFGFGQLQLNQKETLITAKEKATSTGDSNWKNVIELILKYGGAALTILSTSGVIKNKNLSTVANGEYDRQALSDLLNANGGTLDKKPEEIQVPTRSAIDLNNPVILLAAAAGLYLLLKK